MRNSTVCLSITLLGLIHWPALALSSKCSTNICRLSLQSALTSGCQGHVMTEGPDVCLHLLSSSYTMLLCARENSSLPESLQWIIQTGGLRTNARKSEYWHQPSSGIKHPRALDMPGILDSSLFLSIALPLRVLYAALLSSVVGWKAA